MHTMDFCMLVICHRFIKQNLLVELTSSKFAAVFTWVLRRHTIISYLLYMAGAIGDASMPSCRHVHQVLVTTCCHREVCISGLSTNGGTHSQPKLCVFLLVLAGFVSFVLSLKRGMYLYQFGQYAWTHMILLVVFVPSSFFVSNIFEGLIWFLLPCCLIIVNDIMAYLAGEHA